MPPPICNQSRSVEWEMERNGLNISWSRAEWWVGLKKGGAAMECGAERCRAGMERPKFAAPATTVDILFFSLYVTRINWSYFSGVGTIFCCSLTAQLLGRSAPCKFVNATLTDYLVMIRCRLFTGGSHQHSCVSALYQINNKKAVLSQRWPRDARYIGRSWAVARCGHSKLPRWRRPPSWIYSNRK